MHTGTLPQLEIDRIERIVRDWIRQVGRICSFVPRILIFDALNLKPPSPNHAVANPVTAASAAMHSPRGPDR